MSNGVTVRPAPDFDVLDVLHAFDQGTCMTDTAKALGTTQKSRRFRDRWREIRERGWITFDQSTQRYKMTQKGRNVLEADTDG